MASILRQIVASPRARHPEAGLDLCYVTDNIIATSGPGATYPQVAYRNPLKDLVKFLDSKHGEQWAIWEFRAEGTGYPDSEVYGRVWHYPWPDHHPPPFALIPLIMGSMRNWLKDKYASGRVVVVHCKAGKGRSGTISCSYLISEEGWTAEDAMQRFTEKRMRQGFGVGISIPSQQRWIRYVDRWTHHGKKYVERPVEVLELHVWGLRDGVKICVEGYVEEGKVIKKFHTFHSKEREIVRGQLKDELGFAEIALEAIGRKKNVKETSASTTVDDAETEKAAKERENATCSQSERSEQLDSDVIFRPSSRVVLPSSDINIGCERRNKSKLGGMSMVTSVAHVWFNAFFEGQGPEKDGISDDSGVFDIEWDAMDGIKGSSRKGTRAFDKIAVLWKAVDVGGAPNVVISEPAEGEEVRQTTAADWRGEKIPRENEEGGLGLRPDDDESTSVSRASSMRSGQNGSDVNESEESLKGVKTNVPNGHGESNVAEQSSPLAESSYQNDMQHVPPSDLPEGSAESQMEDHQDRAIGTIKKENE